MQWKIPEGDFVKELLGGYRAYLNKNGSNFKSVQAEKKFEFFFYAIERLLPAINAKAIGYGSSSDKTGIKNRLNPKKTFGSWYTVTDEAWLLVMIENHLDQWMELLKRDPQNTDTDGKPK